MSLAQDLEDELGPEPKPERRSSGGSSGQSPHARANAIDTFRVLDLLGIEHDEKHAKCPGCGEDGALICKNGGIKCLHDRCAHAGPRDFKGFRTNVDLAEVVRGGTTLDAALHLCEHFGISLPERRQRGRNDGGAGYDDDPDYTPQPPDEYERDGDTEPAPDREPGDDAEDATAATTGKQSALKRFKALSMLDLMQAVVDQLNKRASTMGARTGHPDLDAALGGFRPGNVTVFGAKRGFGKTSYGNMVTNLAVPRLNVLMFAGEDAAAMYGKRFLAARANLNAILLRDYRCNRADWPNITGALHGAPTNPFFIQVEGHPVEWIARAIAEIRAEQTLDVVIVDYLQKIRAAARLQDRRNEVTYVTATLQDAVKKAGAAGLFFSQLKRSDREEPEIEDLKESGDIEDMADHILLGWKVAATNNDAAKRWIKVAKNKDGTEATEISAVEMPWNSKTANFTADTSYDPYSAQDYTEQQRPTDAAE